MDLTGMTHQQQKATVEQKTILEKYPTQILPHIIAFENRQKELDLSSILYLQPQLQLVLQYWLDEDIKTMSTVRCSFKQRLPCNKPCKGKSCEQMMDGFNDGAPLNRVFMLT